MTLSALSLAALTTAAASTAKVAVDSLARAGESFAELLATESNADAKSGQGKALTLPQKLDALSDQLRQWLASRNISSPFELKLQLDEAGYSELQVQGEQSQEIEALLQEEPQWRQQLTRLATSAQATAAGLFSTPIELLIDQSESHLSFRR